MTRKALAPASILTLCLTILTILIALAGTGVAQNPVPFVDQPLVPDAAAPGGAGFTLTVNGAGFLATSTVNWNGSPRATLFVNSSQLTAAILASDIATASTATVTVVNPSPGGGASNTVFFPVAVPESSVSLDRTDFSSAGGNINVVTADFDGDGKLDLASADYYNSLVRIFLGNGDGTFRLGQTYAACNAHGLDVGDFNGDGMVDLVVADAGCGSVTILLGNGDGTFREGGSFSTGGDGTFAPYSVAVGDFNSDGKLDLVTADELLNQASVLIGNGDGTFQPFVAYPARNDSRKVVTGDFNRDGHLDFAVTSSSGVSVLLGNGNGTFQPQVSYSLASTDNPFMLAADLNRDGKLDLAVVSTGASSGSNTAGSVSVMLGNGDGTFNKPVVYPTNGYSAAVVAADFYGNGILDLVTTNYYTSNISLLPGNGDGTFGRYVNYPADDGARGIVAADFNGDGRLDLAVGNQFVDLISIYLHTPSGGTAPTTTILTSSPNPSLAGQTVAFSATVSSTSGTPPNGEIVTFNNGSATLGSAALTGGVASFASSLPAGLYSITASYPGDANFAASTSTVLRQVVNSTTKSATATALVSNLNPSIYGQSVSWTATVTTSGAAIPTGTVAFTWSGYTIGTAKLNASGVATLTRSNLNADSYPLSAVYKGDAKNLGSTSAVLNQVVQQTTSSATLTSSPNPSAPGQAVTFTAQISSPTVLALGPVTFTSGKTVLGTVELSGGKATFTTSTLATGATTVTVTYTGDSNIRGSSASATQVVQQSIGSGASSTALTYTENPSTLAETFTATVTSSSGTPTGTVTFTVGSTTLGTVPLTSGQATLNTTTLAVGSNTVTATYSGNSEMTASSAWVTQTFVMPVSGALYLQQEGGSAGATTSFGLGTSSTNFVPYYTGLPNSPNPTGELLVGTFPAGTLINFGMYTTFGSQSGYAFSTGTDQASLVSFADLSNSLGMDHGITQQTSPTTWLLHLDDAESYLVDDDNNDVLMELIVVPN